MRELPDVEAYERSLDSTAARYTVQDVHPHEPPSVHRVPVSRPRRTLPDRELAASRRHGKWLFASAGEDGAGARLALLASRGALLAVLLAVPVSAPLRAQQPAPSRWWSEVDRVEVTLQKGQWRKAERMLRRVRPEVMRVSWREPDLGQVLSELAFQAAVIHANRAEDDDALWEWHVAQAHERLAGPARGGPPLLERDLAPYGRAAELLPVHPLRKQGEAPPGKDLPEGTLFLDFERAISPQQEILPLGNVNATRARLRPVTFEVWVDREGRISQPVVLSRWSPVVIVQWGFDNLRGMKPFTPAVWKGEAVGSLEEVELELASASRF